MIVRSFVKMGYNMLAV